HLREFKRQADLLYHQQKGMTLSTERFDVNVYQGMLERLRVLIYSNANLVRVLYDISDATKIVNELLNEYRTKQKGLEYYVSRCESRLQDISRGAEECERNLRVMLPWIDR